MFLILITMAPAHSFGADLVPGHVEGWGDNSFNQISPPAGFDGVKAVAAGANHSLALLTNGTVVAWGNNTRGQTQVPDGLTNVVAISAGAHSVALKEDGTVVLWGSNLSAVTTVPPNATNVIAIEAGYGANGNIYTVALRSDGTVVAWGLSSPSEVNVPAGLNNVKAIFAGSYHVLALKQDGTVVGWGGSGNGAATPPPGLAGVIGVAAGQEVSFAIKADGTVVKWGINLPSYVPPPDATGVVDIQLGNQHVIALRDDGSVLGWGENVAGSSTVPAGLGKVSAIAAGGNQTLVITPKPRIISISPSVVAEIGSTANFLVSASGNELEYQWRFNGSNIEGENGSSLAIVNVRPLDAGIYSVEVSNPYGSVISSGRSLSFPPPVIGTAPQNQSLQRGEEAVFSVSAEGLEPLYYQWQRNGTNLPGATEATLTIPLVNADHTGMYRVVISDVAGGMVTSAAAILTVTDPTKVMVILEPELDTTISSSGSNPKGITTLLSGTRDNGGRDRALLKFNFSSIPSSGLVSSAMLRLEVVMIPRSPRNSNFSLQRVITPWTAAATWANSAAGTPWGAPGALNGVDFSSMRSATTMVSGRGEYEFGPTAELAADVRFWITEPASNHGWLIRSENENVDQTARHFASSEGTETPPQLVITYSTLPPAPEVTEIKKEAGAFTFTLNGAAGWIYRIEYREAVAEGTWTILTNAPAGAGTTPIIVTSPFTGSRRFYRIIAE